MLLVMMALHAVLGVSAIWYNGEDAWEKAHTVSMWLLVAAGLLGTWLFIPDASVVARIVVVVVCVASDLFLARSSTKSAGGDHVIAASKPWLSPAWETMCTGVGRFLACHLRLAPPVLAHRRLALSVLAHRRCCSSAGGRT